MTTVVGILGGIGSGKSTIARLFRRHGAEVVDADEIAGEVTARPDVLARIEQRFGAEVLDDAGGIDRDALARRVFGAENEAALRDLEGIVHPAVRIRVNRLLAEARERGADVVILDVPLLLEKGYRESCDRLLFVRSSRAARVGRVAARGWSEEELDRREAAQTPLSEKIEAADLILDNEDDLEEVAADVRDIVAQLAS